MRYTVRKSVIHVIGKIWMPAITTSHTYVLREYDIENIRDRVELGITRKNVDSWLTCNSGDFQSIADFSASIEDGDQTIDIPWKDEGSEIVFSDCLYPCND